MLVALFAPLAFAAPSIPEAQAALAQYNQELQAAKDAQMHNDAQGVTDHETKAIDGLKQSIAMFKGAGAADSSDPKVLRDYATALTTNGDADIASGVLRRLVTLAPNDATALTSLGQALGAMGKQDKVEAVKVLRQSLKLDSMSPAAGAAYAALGKIYRNEGLYEFARENYAKAVELDPSNLPAKLSLAALKIRDGDIAEASKELDALGALPLEYSAQLPMVVAEAVHGFETSARVFEDTAENHMAFAKLLLRAGRIPEALNAALRSAELKADDFATWNFIGDVALQLNKKPRAKEAYAKSLELKPDQPVTKEALDGLDK